MFTDAMLYEISCENSEISRVEKGHRVFQVRGVDIPVYGEKIGQALAFLLPRDREIILLYFFLGMDRKKIAWLLNVDPSTISRHRKAAIHKLRNFLEDSK